jgi:toxin ParE1/3/4
VTRRLHSHHDAEVELVDAIEWYEHEREGLGRELWDEVQRTIALIDGNPEIGGLIRQAKVSPHVRRVPLRRFPYFIIYREREADIQIVAFAHMSRRPGYWRTRRG